MKCPYCGNAATKVTNKRDAEDITRRRRECLGCKRRFTTHEKPDIEIVVIKKDERREPYNRIKLVNGLIKACEKRPVNTEKIEKVADEIEEKIRIKGKEVYSKQIGELVMKALKKLDKVAYIRFASVYRDFKEVKDFREVIKEVS